MHISIHDLPSMDLWNWNMPLGGETLEMETNSMEDQKHIIRRDTEIKRKFNLTAIELFTYIKV